MRSRAEHASFPLMLVVPIAALMLGSFASGCSASAPRGVPAETVLGQKTDDLDCESLAIAAERTSAALGGIPAERTFELGRRKLSAAELAASARTVASIARGTEDAGVLTSRLAAECEWYPAGERAKVTGYYEPVLDARRTRDSRYAYPIYRRPEAEALGALTKKLGHVPTRADIDGAGALDGLGLEIAWLADPVERFFLHVQGSGRLVFEDGSEERVGFGGTNELPYVSIGTVMIQRGMLDSNNSDAGAIRAWLAKNPGKRDEILFENQRYIFFRETGPEGPTGALGATLVEGRSIATDERHVPRGALAWLATEPGGDDVVRQRIPVSRFVFAQDAGAAIEGPARVDLFEGSGEAAGFRAGKRNEEGDLYLLYCGAK